MCILLTFNQCQAEKIVAADQNAQRRSSDQSKATVIVFILILFLFL